MPKIRGIKPDLWTDENFVELSPLARLLWIGMWNYACDNGHLQDKSKQIKMRVLPTDEVNCAELLREIEDQRLIHRADGWITIPNLSHHQKPHKRWYVVCEKPGCEHPEGTSYGYSKPESTVEQPLSNGSTTVSNGGSTADVDVDIDGDLIVKGEETSEANATDPAPSTHLAPSHDDRPDVERICEHLAEQIEAMGSKPPPITARWRKDARLMLDRDGRTEEQVHACIKWLFTSDHPDAVFWRPNVRAMPKLRAEYDRFRLLAERQAKRPGGRAEEWKSMQERQMARAIEREREMGIQR